MGEDRATVVMDDYERGFEAGRSSMGELHQMHWNYVIWLEQRVMDLEGQKDAIHTKVWKFWRDVRRQFSE